MAIVRKLHFFKSLFQVIIRVSGLLLILLTNNAFAQSETEIFLFDLQLERNRISLSNGRNITNHPGYDNQPFFHPEKTIVYFTAADTSGRTDIVLYDYSKDEKKKLTSTRESEYSPTVTPDGKFISCIIQREDGTQDLGKYPIAGGDPVLVVNTLKVGYHVWADSESLILFVLGEPNTLQWYSTAGEEKLILAENVGRSLHSVQSSGDVSFVQKIAVGKWLIRKIDKSKNIITLVETLPEREDLAWTPDGRIVMSDGEKLYYFEPGVDKAWREIEVNSSFPLKGISRISVNRTGDKIGIVIAE